jgi:GTPase SAR1 family protein
MEITADKIAIVGLANAGKTSIIKCINHEFDVIASLSPTFGVKRNMFNFLGNNFLFWDYGGQIIYREKYLKDPAKYFLDTSVVYYIVDVQDTEKIDESIEFYKLVTEEILKLNPNVKYNIAYHKFDPDLNKEQLKEAKNNAQRFLDGTIKFNKEKNLETTVFSTSIFNVLSIITAISKSVLLEEDISKSITNVLELFGKDWGLDFAILFTENFMELGNYRNEALSESELDGLIKIYFDKFDASAIDDMQSFMKFMSKTIVNSNIVINYGINKVKFNAVVGMPTIESEKEALEKELQKDLDKLAEDLKKLLMTVDLSKYMGK